MENPSKGISSRTKPSVGKALLIYAVYLAIFYVVWAITKVKYEDIGTTVESTKLWYAYPTLAGGASIVLLVTLFGWWRGSLFDKIKSNVKSVWIIPILMIGISVLSLSKISFSELPQYMLLWAVLGGIGVGFGEEMITRGSMIFGLRSKYPELRVWLISTLLFSALHIPNVIFGLRPSGLAAQLLFTFIMGSGFYMIRRVSGSLFLPMILHGLWDSSVFLTKAADLQPPQIAVFIYPVVVVILVIYLVKFKKSNKLSKKEHELAEA